MSEKLLDARGMNPQDYATAKADMLRGNPPRQTQQEPATPGTDIRSEIKRQVEAGHQVNLRHLDKAPLTGVTINPDGTLNGVAEYVATAKERAYAAELEALALREGLVDLDGLKLLDLSKIIQKEDGTFEGVDEVFKAARETKPYLFRKETKPAPKPSSGLTLTAEEYQKQKKALIANELRAGLLARS